MLRYAACQYPPLYSDAHTRCSDGLCVRVNGIALIPARTETAMFFECVWPAASAVLFLRGRPHFHYVDGRRAPFNSGAPICLVAYGSNNVQPLLDSGLGIVTILNTR